MHAENIDVKIKFYFLKLTSMCFIKNIHLREEAGSCQHTKVLCFFFLIQATLLNTFLKQNQSMSYN